MRSAAALLAAPPGAESLVALLRAVGLTGGPHELDADARDALGLSSGLRDVRVCTGAGALRGLLVRVATPGARDEIARIASRLASRTPQLLWLVAVEGEACGERVVASWSADRVPPRVVALTVERDRVVDSDAETLCALAAASGSDDLLVHARWLEILGRDALTRRFYHELERVVQGLADSLHGRIVADERRTLAVLCTSRLLFLAFVEAKGWLAGDRDYLSQLFLARMADGGEFHRRALDPLFYGTLNTRPRDRAPAARALGDLPYLNGGLFTRTPLERRWRRARFSDEALGAVFDDLLARYRLTAREDRASWSDAAVDPEMLGRAFEALMASNERRASGAYYTPHALVGRVTDEAIAAHLGGSGIASADVQRLLAGGSVDEPVRASARAALHALRVLDPACGSGAFLVHVLERIADLLQQCGGGTDATTIRRGVLTRGIFGVDANPTAVWLCELRLWLSAVTESAVSSARDVTPLPNLDHNVRVGDSLTGPAFGSDSLVFREVRSFATLRQRFVRATGLRKRSLARELARMQRTAAQLSLDAERARVAHARREIVLARRQRDLFGERPACAAWERELGVLRARTRELRASARALADGRSPPFSFPTVFPDVAAAGGFDMVIGNPPWVRLHNIAPSSRERLRRDFEVYRSAAWVAGAAGAGAGHGFAAQVDLASLFVERSVHLLRDEGVLALLVPAKVWRSLAGGGLRGFLQRHAPPIVLDDWSASAPTFDAAVYPSLLVARTTQHPDAEIRCVLHHRARSLDWSIARAALPLDESAGSPWLIAPGDARVAFDRLRAAGPTLTMSRFGRPMLGVKCGLNEAFVLPPGDHTVEREITRPLVRGEGVTPWNIAPVERIIWTHGDDGRPLPALPELAHRRLARFRRALLARSDARGGAKWWSLFRVEGALGGAARVVWADVGRTPRAAYVAPDDPVVALNSCYVARCPSAVDALALTALLNSPLAAAWLSLIAEPARGGYHRYLGWTMALLPIPRDWERARTILAPLTERARAGDIPSPDELFDAAARAYMVQRPLMAPLVAWACR